MEYKIENLTKEEYIFTDRRIEMTIWTLLRERFVCAWSIQRLTFERETAIIPNESQL